MKRTSTKYLIAALAYLSVFYPIGVYIRSADWSGSPLILNLFPVFGLAAFTLLWLHAMSGVFEPWLRKQFDFDRFVHITSLLILLCIILHPLLMLISINFDFRALIGGGLYIWLAIIGWFLLITYDIGKALKRYDFFSRNWNKILLISTIGFLFTFFHSLGIGDNLQAGPLRVVWIFYGVTAILATIYTYGIKMFQS